VPSQQTRWLNDREQLAWRTFLTACQTVFGAVESQLLRDSDIPHGYYEVLVRLSETPGRALRMTQLAEASTSSKSRLSHAVARLEERGWVKRTDCPTDRRGQIAQLTDEGYAALAAAAPGHAKQVRRSLIDRLTPEQVEQLLQICTAILAGADPSQVAETVCCGADLECPADPECPGDPDCHSGPGCHSDPD
jgi:DNA-binding MarR family transcriptional regulator